VRHTPAEPRTIRNAGSPRLFEQLAVEMAQGHPGRYGRELNRKLPTNLGCPQSTYEFWLATRHPVAIVQSRASPAGHRAFFEIIRRHTERGAQGNVLRPGC
jgi:hypothetical protein